MTHPLLLQKRLRERITSWRVTSNPYRKPCGANVGVELTAKGDASEAIFIARSYRNVTRKHYGVKVKSGSLVRGCEASLSYVVSGLGKWRLCRLRGVELDKHEGNVRIVCNVYLVDQHRTSYENLQKNTIRTSCLNRIHPPSRSPPPPPPRHCPETTYPSPVP